MRLPFASFVKTTGTFHTKFLTVQRFDSLLQTKADSES